MATFELLAEDLKQVLNALSVVEKEGKINIDEGGWNTLIVDPASVMMVALTVPSVDFLLYEVSEPIELCISFVETISNISSSKKGDIIHIEVDGNILKINYGKIRYEQKTLSPDIVRKSPKQPHIPHDIVNIELPTKEMEQAVIACNKLGDFINIDASKDQLSVWTDGMDSKLVSVIAEIPTGKNQAFALFSTDYMIDAMKGIKHTETFEMSISTDMPIEIVARVCRSGKIWYLMAPRIGE